jgi:DNA-binding transcriptional ArsR family regulator
MAPAYLPTAGAERRKDAAPALDIASLVSVSLPLVTTYEQAALEALGDPTRREIFERLSRSPLAVGELAGGLPISRPAVSQHLKVLKEAGLVFDRPAGTRRVYQVDPRAVEALREYFDAFWGQALQNFQRAVEAPTDVHQSKESR